MSLRQKNVWYQREIRRQRRRRTIRWIAATVLFCFAATATLSIAKVALAQPKPVPPDDQYLFIEDQQKKQKKDKSSLEAENLRQKKKQFDSLEKSGKLPFDIHAKEINFDQTGNKILADGGLIISYSSMVLEAIKGVVDLSTNVAKISGDVRISDLSGTMTADSAQIDLKTGVGTMENADAFFSAGEFQLKGEELGREENDIYTIKDGTLTTCNCAEGKDCPPWRLRVNSARIQRNGYGEAWGAKLDVLNVPVLYTPYLIFPAKTERQTGLLPFTFGNGRESGFELRAPFFWAINSSTDLTMIGVYESNVRVGLDNEFRKVFSRDSKLQTGLIYFNESARDGKLLGTNVDGLSDATFDEDRFGGYWKQDWKGQAGEVPLQFLARGKYVSDDLFLREYENPNIGAYNTRYVTSSATFRAPISSEFSADLSGEFNQSVASDNDDLVFQRLPELELSGVNVFRPFGENPFGMKLVATSDFDTVNFVRKKGYDGSRSELTESVKLPFNFRNIFESSVEAQGLYSYYSLGNTDLVESSNPDKVTGELKDNSDRFIPSLTAKMNTVVEKVFDVDEGNILRTVGELGDAGRDFQLSRVKHTIEPGLKYKLVPQVNQDDNPQFDSLDHLAQKNLVTYQLVQRLLGRYEPRNAYLYGIEEATPEVSELTNLRSASPIDLPMTFGFDSPSDDDFQRLRTGSVREMATLKISQSYDLLSETDSNTGTPGNGNSNDQSAFSDISTDLILYLNDYVYLRGKTDFNPDTTSFSDYLAEGQVQDKRGDRIRTRLRFVEDQVRQLEGNLELKISDSLKVGYYGLYDDIQGEFIESKLGLRYVSQCKCWIFDVDFTDRINPDETKVLFNITLVGLGELNQKFFPAFLENKNQRQGQGGAAATTSGF